VIGLDKKTGPPIAPKEQNALLLLWSDGEVSGSLEMPAAASLSSLMI
jgi:hypothetical protein